MRLRDKDLPEYEDWNKPSLCVQRYNKLEDYIKFLIYYRLIHSPDDEGAKRVVFKPEKDDFFEIMDKFVDTEKGIEMLDENDWTMAYSPGEYISISSQQFQDVEYRQRQLLQDTAYKKAMQNLMRMIATKIGGR